jgi:hypothetical protein
MTDFQKPKPIVDSREKSRFSELTEEYDEFRSPGLIGRTASRAGREVSEAGRRIVGWVPGMSKPKGVKLGDVFKNASKAKYVDKALSKAGKGAGKGMQWCAQGTLSKDAVLKRLQESGVSASEFSHICAERSYDIAALAERDWKSRAGAAIEGVGTGALGGFGGVALNLALSTVLFLRATQRVALHFGYDAVGREEEQVIAAEITLKCLQPSEGPATGETGSLLSKMMMAAEVSALKDALQKKTYEEMAKAGGAQLLYTQIRALANKIAQEGLEQAGREGFEQTLVRRLLRDLGEQLPKRTGQRIVPVVGGVIGGAIDTWQMHQVIQGSKLFYHKRFIAEKDERVRRLEDFDSDESDAAALVA